MPRRLRLRPVQVRPAAKEWVPGQWGRPRRTTLPAVTTTRAQRTSRNSRSRAERATTEQRGYLLAHSGLPEEGSDLEPSFSVKPMRRLTKTAGVTSQPLRSRVDRAAVAQHSMLNWEAGRAVPDQRNAPRARALPSSSRDMAVMEDSKPVDHPDRKTVEVRQGTGPRATVSVLLVSLLLAAVAGLLLLAYFYAWQVPSG